MNEYSTFLDALLKVRGRADWRPHGWQVELGGPTLCRNRLIQIPTGLGTTDGGLGAWLFHAVGNNTRDWLRRLLWCLPMRTLVEQTRKAVERWLLNLGIPDEVDDPVSVHILKGGADAGDWYKHPQRDAILIGTHEMLLSRALIRGYGMSRFFWPVDFTLLNNDCWWVLNETQLMLVRIAHWRDSARDIEGTPA